MKIEKFKILLNETKDVYIELDITRTLDDNLIINDHPYFSIIISDHHNKIITVPKMDYNEYTLDRQIKFFDFMVAKGIIAYGSVHATIIHMSLEGKLPHNLDVNSMQVALMCIYDFIKREFNKELKSKEHREKFEKSLLDPSDEDSTQLGEVPHETEKGSIPTHPASFGTSWYGSPSGFGGYSRIY
jgi:hypothetical protein